MKLLLDENLPHDLRHLLADHQVFTVTFMQWSGIKNGMLLQLAANKHFDALITLDSGMAYQHNISVLPCSIVIIHCVSNKLADVERELNGLLQALAQLQPCTLVHVGPD